MAHLCKVQASELPLRPDGAIYHLAMRPDQASHRCLLVGDPGRVALAEPLLDQIQHRGANREFVWVTGLFRGVAVTVLGTGIGPDNTEIAVLELDALHNVDFARGRPFPTQKKLYLLRLGTCGLLQDEVPLGAAVFSQAAIGVDPLPFFYAGLAEPTLTAAIREYWEKQGLAPLPWYGAKAGSFFSQLATKQPASTLPWAVGLTYSAPGFYAPQGRQIRTPIAFPSLPDQLANFSYQGLRVQNIEMETSALYGLAEALGHEAGALCLGIAHRKHGTFLYRNGGLSPQEAMQHLVRLALEWLSQAP